MRRTMVYWLAALLLTFLPLMGGCRVTTDPETGEKLVQVDPNTAAKIETGASAAATGLTVLSPFVPWLTPVAGIVAGVLGAWLKIKPKLTAAQSDATMYHSATESIVLALESFKTSNPTEWRKLSKILGDNTGVRTENVVRALRGLPAKE